MNTSVVRKVFIDDKFDIMAEEFAKRQWTLTCNKEECDFLFTNLRNIDFGNHFPETTILNHFKGSFHLSNKVYRVKFCKVPQLLIYFIPYHRHFLHTISMLQK